MPTLERGTATISYEDWGTGEPVLLVHGGLFDPMDGYRFWIRPGIVDDLAAIGYRVLAPDRRFCGRTSAPFAPHSWQSEASDLQALLRAAHVPRAAVVAGSNGCSAAVRLALTTPSLVSSLVLCWPAGPMNVLLWDAFERAAASIELLGPAAYLDMLRLDGVPRPEDDRAGFPFGLALLQDEQTATTFLQLSATGAAAAVRASAEALLPGSPLRGMAPADAAALGELGIPIAVMPAEPDDADHPIAAAIALAAAVPGARLVPGFPISTSPRFAEARDGFGRALWEALSLPVGAP